MVKQLLGRGALSGAVAGLVAFVFARLFAEPLIQQAIDFEDGHSHDHEEELVSRSVQSLVGLGTGMILFGVAMGALVAVGYVVAIGRTGRVRPFPLALLVPAFYFVGVFAVPFLKYPANPPAIGDPDTIRDRGAAFLITVAVSCLALFLAVYVGQQLRDRLGLYRTVLATGLGYAVVMGLLFWALPSFHETPAGFPADVLAKFRVDAILSQVLLFGTIALVFAPLADRVLRLAAVEEQAPALV
ncbi:MAG TPA: CbtA family protein [Nocardioides sp.]|nr:CbtA family protein [Nocardioides sp.]